MIVGIRNDRMHIATANHIVRRGGQEIKDLRVLFDWLPGEWTEAKLLDTNDSTMDLAVLSVENVKRLSADALATSNVTGARRWPRSRRNRSTGTSRASDCDVARVTAARGVPVGHRLALRQDLARNRLHGIRSANPLKKVAGNLSFITTEACFLGNETMDSVPREGSGCAHILQAGRS